jgi:hypothetical protein
MGPGTQSQPSRQGLLGVMSERGRSLLKSNLEPLKTRPSPPGRPVGRPSSSPRAPPSPTFQVSSLYSSSPPLSFKLYGTNDLIITSSLLSRRQTRFPRLRPAPQPPPTLPSQVFLSLPSIFHPGSLQHTLMPTYQEQRLGRGASTQEPSPADQRLALSCPRGFARLSLLLHLPSGQLDTLYIASQLPLWPEPPFLGGRGGRTAIGAAGRHAILAILVQPWSMTEASAIAASSRSGPGGARPVPVVVKALRDEPCPAPPCPLALAPTATPRFSASSPHLNAAVKLRRLHRPPRPHHATFTTAHLRRSPAQRTSD